MAENDEVYANLVAELSEVRSPLYKSFNEESTANMNQHGIDSKTNKRNLKQKGRTAGELLDARKESHKIIEQKRRQKMNDKINELRELLNYPDGSQNKAVVLQAAVDNIKNLKMVCSRLLSSHKQLQEEYLYLLTENEKLRKSDIPYLENTEQKKKTLPNIPPPLDLRLPDMNLPFLYDDPTIPTIPPRPIQRSLIHNIPREIYQLPFTPPFTQESVEDTNRVILNRLL